MADKKIADLNEATTLSDTDVVIVEDNANTKKMTWANLKTAIIGAFSPILGNRTYTEQNVVTNGESITKSIDELDVGLASHKADLATDDVHGLLSLYNTVTNGLIPITGLSNIDNIENDGLTLFQYNDGATGSPTTNRGVGIQLKIGSNKWQLTSRYNTSASNLHVRHDQGTGFTAWKTI